MGQMVSKALLKKPMSFTSHKSVTYKVKIGFNFFNGNTSHYTLGNTGYAIFKDGLKEIICKYLFGN